MQNFLIKNIQEKIEEKFNIEALPLSKKQESYKYLPLEKILDFNLKVEGDFLNIKNENKEDEKFSLNIDFKDSVEISKFDKNLFNIKSEKIEKFLNLDNDSFFLMPFLFLKEALVIDVLKTPNNPININYFPVDKGNAAFSFIIFNIKEGIEATVLENLQSAKKGNEEKFLFINSLFNVGKKARLENFKIVNFENNEKAFIQSKKNLDYGAIFNQVNANNLQNSFLRERCDINFCKEQTTAEFSSISVLNNKSNLDLVVFANHQVSKSTSKQNIKTILEDDSTSSFLGEVEVKKGTKKVFSNQVSKSILLSEKGKSFARPWLKIFADDVSCSHGATFGELEKNALFYLQTRGLTLDEAKKMLLRAQVCEILNLSTSEEFIQNSQRIFGIEF